MSNPITLIHDFQNGNVRSLARAITIVENEIEGYDELLAYLTYQHPSKVIGITGPPGAGKSSIINAMLTALAPNFRIAVLAVDPTSPFTKGSLLGDRLRMYEHFNNENVFIRSLATRGALGGLSAKAFEIVDVLRAANFDYIIIETVGVGQSEVEIAALADTTVVVLVPESGDDVQMIKSGIVEVADIFVVNKCDRDGAQIMMKNISLALHERPVSPWHIPVLKTNAVANQGIDLLIEKINAHHNFIDINKKQQLQAEQLYRIIQSQRMRDITIENLQELIEREKGQKNMYQLAKKISG